MHVQEEMQGPLQVQEGCIKCTVLCVCESRQIYLKLSLVDILHYRLHKYFGHIDAHTSTTHYGLHNVHILQMVSLYQY